MKKIFVLDTTLRDGEQSPGAKLNVQEKIIIAKQLEILGVDCIEAGFPSSSKGDFEAVSLIAKNIKNTMVTGLARAVKSDIDSVYDSIKGAVNPMIHIVLGVSDIHVEQKFRKNHEQILEVGAEAVKYAKKLLPQVQYSTEDASRADFEYLWKTIETVIKAGATMINVPDTVGYAVPAEFGAMIAKIYDRIMNLDDSVMLSVHCHNDMGLATANTLYAIKNGANKVECTINGIGERAGNAALEEVVMGIKVRSNYYQAYTDINTKQIANTSRLVSSLMGLDVQVNKAITGENAFAHSSGIHQDGLLKSKEVYEIINPKDVGIEDMELVLTARSGRHAVKSTIAKMGYQDISTEDFEKIFTEFIALADKKKEIYYHDLYSIIQEVMEDNSNGSNIKIFELIDYQVISSSLFPSASIKLRCNDDVMVKTGTGNGPIDALYATIKELTGCDILLLDYRTSSISRGTDAIGRVKIKVKYKDRIYNSSATDIDVVKASALALVNCINKINIEATVKLAA